MKMVFFSSDRLEVERVSLEIAGAGIPCEVREGRDAVPNLPDAQLWIREDGDLHQAFMLCVERRIGFAKRKTNSPEMDSCDKAVAA